MATMVIIGVIRAIMMTKADNSRPFAHRLKCRVRNHSANLSEPSFCYLTSKGDCTALAAKVTTVRRTVSCTYSLLPAN